TAANRAQIQNSFSDADVSAVNSYVYAGGLVGVANNATWIKSSHATGNVNISNGTIGSAGGLVGGSTGVYGNNASIDKSYATGRVQGNPTSDLTSNAGGLIAYGAAIDISNSFAAGEVTGGHHIGGLAGTIDYSMGHNSVTNSHATGDVTSYSAVS